MVLLRLIEYRNILLSINDEMIEIDSSLGERVWSDIKPNDEYYRGWRQYFEQESPVLFEKKGFEVVRNQLVNTKHIFVNRRRYRDVESAMDILLKFMENNYTLQPSEVESPCKSPTKSMNRNAKEMLAEDGESSVIIKPPTLNHVPEVLKRYGIHHSLEFTENEFLCEYFLYMKKEFSSLFICSIVDHQQIYVRKTDTIGGGLKSLSSLVPVFGSLLSLAGIGLIVIKEMMLAKKLSRITDLALNYKDLPDKISRVMVLLRANSITLGSNQQYKLKQEGIISKALSDLGVKRNLSNAELLAFNDCKIIEGVIFLLIETKQVSVINFPDINDLIHQIIEVLITTKSIVLEFDHSSCSPSRDSNSSSQIDSDGNKAGRTTSIGQRGEDSPMQISPFNKKISSKTEVVIDEEVLKRNEYLPRDLIRGAGEDYEKYYMRVNKYLKVLCSDCRDCLLST